MNRDFLSVVRLILLVVFAYILLAIATRIFPASDSNPAWAALHDAPTTPYRNVIVVAKSGGDFNEVQKALNNITDNSPTNRYLVWVAPGTYTETVTMKQYVDIEGAGELVTKITWTGGQNPDVATLRGASNAELRYLTVENRGGNRYATAIYIYLSSPSFLHVTATATGGSQSNYAFYLATGSSPTLRNVTAIASGGGSGLTNYGIRSMTASPVLTDSLITASGGSYSYAMSNFASSPTIWKSKLNAIGSGNNIAIEAGTYDGGHSLNIDNSTLVGSTHTIVGTCCNVLDPIRVGASKLEGGPVQANYGPITCAGVYDENYAFFPNTCP
jgi:hypothetical protein